MYIYHSQDNIPGPGRDSGRTCSLQDVPRRHGARIVTKPTNGVHRAVGRSLTSIGDRHGTVDSCCIAAGTLEQRRAHLSNRTRHARYILLACPRLSLPGQALCHAFCRSLRGRTIGKPCWPTLSNTGRQATPRALSRIVGKQRMVSLRRLPRRSVRPPIRYWRISSRFLPCRNSKFRCRAERALHRTTSLSWRAHRPDRSPSWSKEKSRSPSALRSTSGDMKPPLERRTVSIFSFIPWVLVRCHGAPSGTSCFTALPAVITGQQYRAAAAILLVHSFSKERVGWTDYQGFTRLFGVEVELGSVQSLLSTSTVPLFGLWVVGNCSFLET
jgi:hypothetical protein